MAMEPPICSFKVPTASVSHNDPSQQRLQPRCARAGRLLFAASQNSQGFIQPQLPCQLRTRVYQSDGNIPMYLIDRVLIGF